MQNDDEKKQGLAHKVQIQYNTLNIPQSAVSHRSSCFERQSEIKIIPQTTIPCRKSCINTWTSPHLVSISLLVSRRGENSEALLQEREKNKQEENKTWDERQ